MWRWLVSMMDVPEMLDMLGAFMARKGMGRGGALITMICCIMIIGPLGYLYWRFDLASTWDWFTWLVSGGEETINNAITDENYAAAAVIMFGFSVTMFPSVIQLGLARFITIPALGILIKAAIAFDMGTDFEPMWKAAQGAAWYSNTFTWEPMAAFMRVVGAVAGTVFVSVLLQSIVIMVLSVGVYCAFIVLAGRVPGPMLQHAAHNPQQGATYHAR